MHNKPEIDTVRLTQITEKIKSNYWGHLSELPFEKQFHFASRLALFGDQQAKDFVAGVKKQFLASQTNLTELLQQQPNPATTNYYDQRAPFFAAYLWLYGAELAAFQCLHASVQYDIDQRPAYTDHFGGEAGLRESATSLLADDETIRHLSTYAVNWLYLTSRFFLDEVSDELPTRLLEILRGYENPTGPNAVLAIYLVTHAIIADSLFYSLPVPRQLLGIYRQMLEVCQPIIEQNAGALTLDVQLEFLIAAHLVGYTAPNQSQILTQAFENFDATLGFITDPNKPDKNDLAGAEHRNVLFLLAVQGLE